jgi:iron complex outermembrane recepter protein
VSKKMLLGGGSALAVILSLGLAAGAQAQDNQVEEVVVTGSFIQGTPEDAALPVDVISAEDLEKKGSPTVVEMVKALTVSNGVVGESNQFAAAGRGQADEGRASVNLRGLGPERTLVLLNGKRVAFSDLNTFPQAAIGRVEVLKDGAAATYGSDAIGGVVNFITKKSFDGVEVGGNYRYVEGSESGQYDAFILAGKTFDGGNVLLSAGYQFKSDLPVQERDWAVQPFSANPDGGWSGASSPTRFLPVSAAFAPTAAGQIDVGCVPLGGVVTADGICRNQFVTWDNIVDKEERYQLYGEVNWDLTENIRFHGEALYAYTEVPSVNTTPSFATTRPIPVNVLPAAMALATPFLTPAPDVPNASNFFYVPVSNPGMAAYCAANPAQCPTGTAAALIQIGQWRPFFLGGNPLFDGEGSWFLREREQTRLSGGFSGSFGEVGFLGEVNWDANITWSQYKSRRGGFDSITGRLQLALRGLGGEGCNPATGTPGAGSCKWFNPFSNAIAGNPNLGLTNPGYNAAVANTDKALISWFFQEADRTQTTTELWEGNLIFNGQSTIELPGGAVGWAVGGQWRRNENLSDPDPNSSTLTTPCAMTLVDGSTTCFPKPTSPWVFIGNINPNSTERNIYAAFAELSLPITDTLNVQLAARYEDYGKLGGDTFNPKASARWQATDWFALRGSVGSTFRAPPLVSLIPDATVTLQNVFGTFRPVEITGNPDLTPEKAFTYSVGAIVNISNFRATLDYWNFELKDVLTSEPQTGVLNVAFPSGSGPAVGGCNDPFILDHFTFNGDCTAANIASVRLLSINGPKINTSGLDLLAQIDFDDVAGGTLEFGASVTYVLEYQVGALTINNVPVSAKLDAVGFYNVGTLAYPLPEWKAELYGEYNRGRHNLRWTIRYIDDYIDQRTANYNITTANTQVTPAPSNPSTVLQTRGRKIQSQTQHDFAYRVQLPWDITANLAIQNVFDKDPPFARTELSYEPLTGSPLGRTVQVGLRKRF